ncbi:MAG: alpha-1,2-fucosyltransferase [Pyrinomonadaceae bacterium]|nr:alpha-1,2-fucosyltransferase [Sphingobacteriaceae bacterium]
MIVIKLDGRLGNQLFQYAFALIQSKNLNSFYVIDKTGSNNFVIKYFKIPSYSDYNFVRQTLVLIAKYTSLTWIEQSLSEPNQLLLTNIRDNVQYKGFFQSADFFDNNRSYLVRKLKIRSKYRKSFFKKYDGIIDKKLIVIHYRLTDYKIFGGDEVGGSNLCLPESYYVNALSQIPDLQEYTVVIVTDDKEDVKSKLTFIDTKVIISDTEINDFQMLMEGNILIISNSTFAWWAAYLSSKCSKVFAPEHWLGFKIKREIPFDIIPKDFIKVSFN